MSDEKKPPHIQYILSAQRFYEEGHAKDSDCMDHVDGIIHNKAEADRIVKFLQENGYKVTLMRITKTYLIEEQLHEDESEPEKEEE